MEIPASGLRPTPLPPKRAGVRVTSSPAKASDRQEHAAGDAAKAMRTSERARRQRDRDFAYRKILALRERVRALKMLAQNRPQGLPAAVAQLAKELAAAVKEYRAAGGKGNSGGDALAGATAPSAQQPDASGKSDPPVDGESAGTAEEVRARDAYRTQQIRQRVEEAEADALSDTAMVRDARGIVKALREYLKIGAAERDPHSEQGKAADDANRKMRRAERDLDAIEGNANAARLTGKLLDLDA